MIACQLAPNCCRLNMEGVAGPPSAVSTRASYVKGRDQRT